MTVEQPNEQMRDYSAISNANSAHNLSGSVNPVSNYNTQSQQEQEEFRMMGCLRRWYECYLKRARRDKPKIPSNDGSESDALLPRPVPDRNGSDETLSSWWNLLPAPTKGFLYKNRWWLIGAIILIIIVILIILISTGNYAYIPLFLRIMLCSFFKDYFNKLCSFDGVSCTLYRV